MKKKGIVALVVLSGLLVQPVLSLFEFSQVDAAFLPVANAGFETAGTSENQAASWQPFNAGYQRTASAAHTGSYGIQVQNSTTATLAGAYQRIDLNQTSVQPVFLGGYVKGNNITMASGSFLGASLYAEIHMTDGSIVYWNSIPNSGTFDWRWIGFNTGSGFTTLTNTIEVTKPIAYILVVPTLGNASGTAYFDDISVQQFSPTQGAVTFMFDDGNSSDFSIAKPALDTYNFKASTAIITNNIGQDGFMTAAELKTLATNGWEIVSHTQSHSDLTTLSTGQITSELQNSKSTLQAQGLSVQNLAVPFGAYNASVAAQASQYYASLRTFEDGYNPLGVYPYGVKTKKVINTTTVADVQQWLAQAKAEKKWLVLTTHLIASNGDDQYITSPATFQAIVGAVAQSGMPVITYQQGIASFAVSKTNATPVPVPPPTTPPSTGTTTPPTTGTTTPTTSCSGDLKQFITYTKTADNKAVITNNSNCSFRVGIAAYKEYDANQKNDTRYSAQTLIISPKTTRSLTTTLPSCAYEVNLFYGNIVESFKNDSYGVRLLNSISKTTGGYCTR